MECWTVFRKSRTEYRIFHYFSLLSILCFVFMSLITLYQGESNSKFSTHLKLVINLSTSIFTQELKTISFIYESSIDVWYVCTILLCVFFFFYFVLFYFIFFTVGFFSLDITSALAEGFCENLATFQMIYWR